MTERLHALVLATTILGLAFGGMAPADAAAQGISVEPRAGVTFPMGDLSDADAEAGTALGADLMLHFHPRFSGYLTVNRHTFGCDEGCELGPAPRSTGLGGGIKYLFPSPPDAIVWVRGGVIAHQYSDDELTGDRSAGFEAGGGIDMLLGGRLFLVPFVGYFQHDAGPGVTATYLTFGVGAHLHVR